MFNNPQLKVGNAEIFIPKGKPVSFEAPDFVTLSTASPDGEIVPIKTFKGAFHFKSPGFLAVETTNPSDIWYINYQTEDITFDKSDPIPVEAAITEAPTMMDRMRALIREEVLNRYGRTDEIETLEEATDRDWET